MQLEKRKSSHYEDQNPYTVDPNLQTQYNYNGVVAYPAPFSYLSSGQDITYDGYMGSGLEQRSCYNNSSWSPQPLFFEGDIPPNTCHVGYSTLS